LGTSGMNENKGYWGGGISIISQNFPKSSSILFHPLDSSISQTSPKDGRLSDVTLLKLFKDGAVPRLGSGATSPKNCPPQDRARARGRPAPLPPPLAAPLLRWSPVAPFPGHGVTPFLTSLASSLSSVPRAVWLTGWRPFLSFFS
jgi:hypothetical protein